MTDDELDRRLAAWGDRERAALPPLPAPRAIPARRGWLAPLAVAAAVVLLVAGVSVLGSGSDDAPAPVAHPARRRLRASSPTPTCHTWTGRSWRSVRRHCRQHRPARRSNWQPA